MCTQNSSFLGRLSALGPQLHWWPSSPQPTTDCSRNVKVQLLCFSSGWSIRYNLHARVPCTIRLSETSPETGPGSISYPSQSGFPHSPSIPLTNRPFHSLFTTMWPEDWDCQVDTISLPALPVNKGLLGHQTSSPYSWPPAGHLRGLRLEKSRIQVLDH